MRMKIKCIRGGKPGQDERGAGWERVKYLKINAISNAQSDYFTRGCQRCKDSDGFFVLIKPFIWKNSRIYIQMEELARITYQSHSWLMLFGKSAVRVGLIKIWILFFKICFYQRALGQKGECRWPYLGSAITCHWNSWWLMRSYHMVFIAPV